MAVTLIFAAITLLYLFTPMGRTARWACAVLIAVGFHVLTWPANRENYLLEKHGMQTTGFVVAKDCRRTSTQWVAYRFSVEGKEYQGRHGVGGGRAGCESVSLGAQTFVTYLRADPSVSRPVREVDSLWFIGLLLTVGGTGMLIWMNAEQTRFRERRRENAA